ncbi:MAG: FecR domain-containing protein [Pseudomonadota bacterium]|nr:FecR domain-containing protein [Pseudomonadota bacterium]
MADENHKEIEQDPLLQAAAQWSAELSSARISSKRIAQWQQWLALSESHRDAFDAIQSTLRAVDRSLFENLPGEDVSWPTDAEMASDAYDGSVPVSVWRARASRAAAAGAGRRGEAWIHALRRRRGLAVGLAASIVVALAAPIAFQFIRSAQLEPSVTIVETRAGENRDVALEDGSVVSAGARSVLWATLSRDAREVTLERGEAFFRVAKDPARPFTVKIGNTRVAAVGTSFNIRRAGERVVVAVADGIVKVDAATAQGNSPARAQLVVGQQLSIDTTDGSSSVEVVDANRIAAWRDGLLQYRDEPLPLVIADVVRYSEHDIVIADPAVAELRVTGTVFTHDVESWLQSIEAALPVRVIRAPDGAVRLESISRK